MGKGSSKGGSQGGGGTHRGGSRPEYSPNDDRAIVKNPTSGAHEADQANREKQGEGK